jgi:hypothetical protein
MKDPAKPTFIIVGSAKCGTTALASILDSHPDCCVSRPKEVSYFQDTMGFEPNPNFSKGWDWYKNAFSHFQGELVIGEATPSYSDRSRSPNTAKRIYEFNPQMKIIYMVRDPLARQKSAWQMQWTFGKEESSPWRREDQWALEGFESWMLKQREAGQWDECRYGFQIQGYRDFFPEKQILVSFLEDWRENKVSEVSRIMKFLCLDPTKWDPAVEESANRGADRSIERPLLRRIRAFPVVRFAVQPFPRRFRDWLRPRISRMKVTPPPATLTKETKAMFLDYVRPDILSTEPFSMRSPQIWKSILE